MFWSCDDKLINHSVHLNWKSGASTFRSVRKKSMAVADYVISENIDIMALTETWLGTGDDVVLRELNQTGYHLMIATIFCFSWLVSSCVRCIDTDPYIFLSKCFYAVFLVHISSIFRTYSLNFPHPARLAGYRRRLAVRTSVTCHCRLNIYSQAAPITSTVDCCTIIIKVWLIYLWQQY